MPVWWVTTAAHDRPMPLDPDPTPAGNVTLDAAGRAVVHPKGQTTLDTTADRYMPHWATCKNPPRRERAGEAVADAR